MSKTRQAIRQGDVVLIPFKGEMPKGETVFRILEVTGEDVHSHQTTRRVAVMERPVVVLNSWGGERQAGFLAPLVVVEPDTAIVHDEHPPLAIPPGVYELHQAREFGRSGGAD